MTYSTDVSTKMHGPPVVLYRDDNFLNQQEIIRFQNLLKNNRWVLGNQTSFDKIDYVSQNLYHHYQWDGNWDHARWLDSTEPDWELLYEKISAHLPKHYVHWVDVKITSAGQSGTPLHRDKDPWTPGGDPVRFKKAISIICNLNQQWDPLWGGGLVLHETNVKDNKIVTTINQTVPIIPGQLIIMENCYHSIEPIVQSSKSRTSFIMHVLEYKHDSN